LAWLRPFFSQKTFIEKNKAKVKHFGMLKHYDDSKKYLTENAELVCEDTANYLVVWCIDLEIEEVNNRSRPPG
jgi:cell division cycle protein 37